MNYFGLDPSNLFSFDASRETPQMLANRRARIANVASRIGMGTPSYGGGIGDLLRGLGAGFANYRTDQNEQAGNDLGNGRLHSETLAEILSQSPQASNMVQPPSNDDVGASIKQSMATGQPPQLAVYSPSMAQQSPVDMTQAQPVPPPISQPPTDTMSTPSSQPAPMVPASNESSHISKIMELLNNPWLKETDRTVLTDQLTKIQQRQDPSYQLQMRMDQLKYDQMAHPDQIPMTQLQQAQLDSLKAKPDIQPFTLGEGDMRFSGDGSVLARGNPKSTADKPPQVESFYDDKTGQMYKAQWNPAKQSWDRVGGNKSDENGITITNPDGTTTQIGGSNRGGGKMTESDHKARLLAGQINTQEAELLKGFDSLAQLQNSVPSSIGGDAVKSAESQISTDALSNVVANWLYLTSGATATPKEIENQVSMIKPSFLDKPERIAAKKDRLKSIFTEMRLRANISAPNLDSNLSDEDLLKKYGN